MSKRTDIVNGFYFNVAWEGFEFHSEMSLSSSSRLMDCAI
jgi:hypothetical protein